MREGGYFVYADRARMQKGGAMDSPDGAKTGSGGRLAQKKGAIPGGIPTNDDNVRLDPWWTFPKFPVQGNRVLRDASRHSRKN